VSEENTQRVVNRPNRVDFMTTAESFATLFKS
jgi:hypothetical protein